jgi:hypothetical protein
LLWCFQLYVVEKSSQILFSHKEKGEDPKISPFLTKKIFGLVGQRGCTRLNSRPKNSKSFESKRKNRKKQNYMNRILPTKTITI